jgi:thioredoxin-related protein
MKMVNLILIFCLMATNTFAQEPLSANDIMAEAFAKAKKENKNVFVKFSASWCGWCKKMDGAMNDTACKKLFDDNFVIVKLIVDEADNNKNLENPGADLIRIKYGGEKSAGLPFWFVLDSKGKLLTDCYVYENNKKSSIGCPATAEEVKAFIEVLKKTTALSNQQLQIISERFRKNEVKGH